MLAEPTPTQYDLHFRFLRFPVRVSPFFFLTAVLLGYERVKSMGHPAFALMLGYDPSTYNPGLELVVWTSAVFLSILIHEAGHGLAWRRYGVDSRLILYHFGGLAVVNNDIWSLGRSRLGPREQIFVSAAGPGLEMLSAVAIMLVIAVAGFDVPWSSTWLDNIPFFHHDRRLPPMFWRWCHYYFEVSIYWGMLNLLPVYPLDGGQISMQTFLLYDRRDPVRHSLVLSMVVAVGVALYAFQQENPLMGMMFLSLAFSSYQMLQQYGMYGGPRW